MPKTNLPTSRDNVVLKSNTHRQFANTSPLRLIVDGKTQSRTRRKHLSCIRDQLNGQPNTTFHKYLEHKVKIVTGSRLKTWPWSHNKATPASSSSERANQRSRRPEPDSPSDPLAPPESSFSWACPHQDRVERARLSLKRFPLQTLCLKHPLSYSAVTSCLKGKSYHSNTPQEEPWFVWVKPPPWVQAGLCVVRDPPNPEPIQLNKQINENYYE